MLQHATVIPFPGVDRELDRLTATLAEVQQAFQQNAALLIQVQQQITGLKARPISPFMEPLTRREVEVMRLVAAGLTNRQIAQRFVLTEGTVKRHMTNILAKLNATGRAEASYKAHVFGII